MPFGSNKCLMSFMIRNSCGGISNDKNADFTFPMHHVLLEIVPPSSTVVRRISSIIFSACILSFSPSSLHNIDVNIAISDMPEVCHL